jgi:Cd2+/Zn2+-exporting ATPase
MFETCQQKKFIKFFLKRTSNGVNFDGLLVFILIVVLVISYAKVLPEKTSDWLLILAVAAGTMPVLLSAFRSLKNKKISIDLLASAALVFSILAKEWESAAFINLMLASARIFADYTENRSRRAIAGLLKLKPHKAKIMKNGELIDVPVEAIKKGDLAVVELGERIPVDGTVEKGEASIDQSSLTGESLPVEKTRGDRVFTSTIVVSGNIIVKTEKTGPETTFEKIINLVEESQLNKPKIDSLVDKFAKWYIIATFLGAGLVYFFSVDLDLVLSLLLVACADDIAVALPLSFLSAIGYAARRGVIIKGGNFIEILARLKTVILDKTGTLTLGRLKVEETVAFGEYKEDEIFLRAGRF